MNRNRCERQRKYLDSYIVVDTKDIKKDKWLKYRQSGIGGSDASAVIGVNPWKSSIQLYMEKKSDSPKEVKSFRLELGNRLEGLVAELFTEKTGLKVRNVNGILKNDKYPFALGNIDRAILGEKAFLECKTTGSYSLKEWQEGIPIHYEIQCLHYMAITGATHCYIAALIGNSEFLFHKLVRDEESINYLMQIEKRFWEENILKDIVPLPDGSDAYSEYLKEKYKFSNNEEIELHFLENGKEKLLRYDDILSDIKQLEKEKKLIEQEIQAHMKEFEVARIGTRKITWKNSSRKTLDSKRLKAEMPDIAEQFMKISTSRIFKIGKEK